MRMESTGCLTPSTNNLPNIQSRPRSFQPRPRRHPTGRMLTNCRALCQTFHRPIILAGSSNWHAIGTRLPMFRRSLCKTERWDYNGSCIDSRGPFARFWRLQACTLQTQGPHMTFLLCTQSFHLSACGFSLFFPLFFLLSSGASFISRQVGRVCQISNLQQDAPTHPSYTHCQFPHSPPPRNRVHNYPVHPQKQIKTNSSPSPAFVADADGNVNR